MRHAAAWSLSLAFGCFALAAVDGLTGSLAAAGAVALLVTLALGFAFRRRLPVSLDPGAAPRSLRWVGALAALVALVQLGRLTVFAVDPTATGFSLLPASAWESEHSCLTAYYVAARAADRTPNVYDSALYTAPGDDPTNLRKPLELGSFRIDVFEYPPPFLLLPRALLPLAPGFERYRALWFGWNGAFVLAVVLLLARRLGPQNGTRALLLSPLLFAALPSLSVLQKGNVQLTVIAGSLLAMLLFERRRFATGGALLAFATASKLFPGLLGIYLLARREWRAAAWTTAFGLVFVALTVADLGWAPFAAFLDHAPKLLSGEAFPAFRNPLAVAINYSIPGLVFKLQLFGVAAGDFAAAKIVGWIYTALATAAVWIVGRRAVRPADAPLVWLAILLVATLRSPFLPQAYAAFPPILLLLLWAAPRVVSGARLAAVLLPWAALNFYWPLDAAIDARALALLTFVPQALTIVLAAVVLRSATQPALHLAAAPATALATAPQEAESGR